MKKREIKKRGKETERGIERRDRERQTDKQTDTHKQTHRQRKRGEGLKGMMKSKREGGRRGYRSKHSNNCYFVQTNMTIHRKKSTVQLTALETFKMNWCPAYCLD